MCILVDVFMRAKSKRDAFYELLLDQKEDGQYEVIKRSGIGLHVMDERLLAKGDIKSAAKYFLAKLKIKLNPVRKNPRHYHVSWCEYKGQQEFIFNDEEAKEIIKAHLDVA